MSMYLVGIRGRSRSSCTWAENLLQVGTGSQMCSSGLQRPVGFLARKGQGMAKHGAASTCCHKLGGVYYGDCAN